MIFIAGLCGVFGLIVGSFLNVLIARHGTAPLTGRSRCLSCHHTLAWYDLVPVISWIALFGRCRYCANRISLQYPIVELLTAAVFALIGGSVELSAIAGQPLLDISVLLIDFAIASLLIAIAVYDLHHTIIPDEWAYLFGALSLLASAIAAQEISLSMIVSGPIAAMPLFFLWLVSRGRWMGLGDPKLALGIGWLLGAYQGLLSIMSAFIVGAIFAICILIPLNRLRGEGPHITMKSEVPFGPFLVLSTFLFWLAGMYGIQLDLFTWL